MFVSNTGSDAAAYGRALLLFLLMAAATAAWLELNLIFPGMQPTGISQIVSRLIINGAILAGLAAALSRARRDFPGRLAARADPGRVRIAGRQRRRAGGIAGVAGRLSASQAGAWRGCPGGCLERARHYRSRQRRHDGHLDP